VTITSVPTYRKAYRQHFNAMADALRATKARPFTVKAVAAALAAGNLNQWFDEDRFVGRALGRPITQRRLALAGELLLYRGGPTWVRHDTQSVLKDWSVRS